MGWLRRLFGRGEEKVTPEVFARRFQRALRRVGDTRSFRFDAEQFRLVEQGVGADRESVINLHNFYAEYQAAPAQARELVVGHFALSMQPRKLPDDWSTVSTCLRPRVVDRARLSMAELQARARGLPSLSRASLPLTEDLTLSLVMDMPDVIASVAWEDCDAWGASREQALSVAVENLARVSREDFERHGALFVSPWHDNHDVSRLTLIEKLTGLPVKGELVALGPHRDFLLLTGSEDEEGLAQLVEQAEKFAREARFMGFYPVVLKEGRWHRFHLEPGHPLEGRYRCLAVELQTQLYAQQKQLLSKAFANEEMDWFVATFNGRYTEDHAISFATWTEGVPTLLPRADMVVLVNPDLTDVPPMCVPWDALQQHAGHLLVRDDTLYPERYQAREFPSDEVLEALRPMCLQGPRVESPDAIAKRLFAAFNLPETLPGEDTEGTP